MKNDRRVSSKICCRFGVNSGCSHVDVVWFIPEKEAVIIFPSRYEPET